MPTHDLSTWRRVADDAALLAAAADCEASSVSAIAKLRKHHTAEDVAVALGLVAARRKAVTKFGRRAALLIADPAGVEQASSLRVARHKAQRFVEAGCTHVADLCCGIGGDAMGFVDAGLHVTAIDRDPVRAWMAGCNAGCATVAADVIEFTSQIDSALRTDGRLEARPTSSTAMHIDPARRNARGRVFRLADHEPDPAALRAMLKCYSDAGVKLSPAVDLDELCSHLPTEEVEFISEGGRLVQAVAWFGPPAGPAPRTATLLLPTATHTLHGEACDPRDLPRAGPMTHLFTVDAAVERAGLLHRIDLPMIHPKLGIFTADTPPPPEASAAPWLTPFRFVADLPFNPRKLSPLLNWLKDHDAGHVEVKTRGKAVDPDTLQPRLHGKGSTPYTLFILRHDQRLVVTIAQRL